MKGVDLEPKFAQNERPPLAGNLDMISQRQRVRNASVTLRRPSFPQLGLGPFITRKETIASGGVLRAALLQFVTHSDAYDSPDCIRDESPKIRDGFEPAAR